MSQQLTDLQKLLQPQPGTANIPAAVYPQMRAVNSKGLNQNRPAISGANTLNSGNQSNFVSSASNSNVSSTQVEDVNGTSHGQPDQPSNGIPNGVETEVKASVMSGATSLATAPAPTPASVITPRAHVGDSSYMGVAMHGDYTVLHNGVRDRPSNQLNVNPNTLSQGVEQASNFMQPDPNSGAAMAYSNLGYPLEHSQLGARTDSSSTPIMQAHMQSAAGYASTHGVLTTYSHDTSATLQPTPMAVLGQDNKGSIVGQDQGREVALQGNIRANTNVASPVASTVASSVTTPVAGTVGNSLDTPVGTPTNTSVITPDNAESVATSNYVGNGRVTLGNVGAVNTQAQVPHPTYNYIPAAFTTPLANANPALVGNDINQAQAINTSQVENNRANAPIQGNTLVAASMAVPQGNMANPVPYQAANGQVRTQGQIGASMVGNQGQTHSTAPNVMVANNNAINNAISGNSFTQANQVTQTNQGVPINNNATNGVTNNKPNGASNNPPHGQANSKHVEMFDEGMPKAPVRKSINLTPSQQAISFLRKQGVLVEDQETKRKRKESNSPQSAFDALIKILEDKVDLDAEELKVSYQDYWIMRRKEARIVQQEVKQNQDEYFKHYMEKIRSSGAFNPKYTFEQLTCDQLNMNSFMFAKQFADEMSEKLSPTLMLILGNAGTGKTALCHAIAQRYLKNKAEQPQCIMRRSDLPMVLFVSLSEIVNLKLYSFNESASDREIRERRYDEICNVDLLIIDDVSEDREELSAFSQKILAEILGIRCEQGIPIVIATPLANTELADKLGVRCFERINSFIVVATCIEGGSRRPRAIRLRKWTGSSLNGLPPKQS